MYLHQNDIRPRLRQRDGHGGPDAARPARHERRAAREGEERGERVHRAVYLVYIRAVYIEALPNGDV